jgi:hypothetical protein
MASSTPRSLEARVDKFTQLLPHYMHVRFTNSMLVSPESMPKDDPFHREDNYYIYLRPDGIDDDATIVKSVKFAGPPPTWIWMPPHWHAIRRQADDAGACAQELARGRGFKA